MSVAKVTVSLEADAVRRIDLLVKERVFQSRSQAVQSAVDEKLERLNSNRLARECAKLDRNEERGYADLGLAADLKEWPEY